MRLPLMMLRAWMMMTTPMLSGTGPWVRPTTTQAQQQVSVCGCGCVWVCGDRQGKARVGGTGVPGVCVCVF